MEQIVGRYFIENSELRESSAFPETNENGTIIYEVIRLIEDTSLFFEEHYNRIINSVYLAKYEINNLPSKETIYKSINQLIAENNIHTGNIKLGFMFLEKEIISYKMYFIPHKYPRLEDYETGVKTISHNAIRKVPNIKIRNKRLREKSDELIRENNVFEILLVNNFNLITEGSRSNIFFIKDNVVYSPKSENILKGITWQYVVRICKNLKIELIEKDININEISNYESCFLTGTSPKVIAIKQINETSFDVFNSIIVSIRHEYEQIILKQIFK
jgi:branched-chain amino acid aminotransferase